MPRKTNKDLRGTQNYKAPKITNLLYNSKIFNIKSSLSSIINLTNNIINNNNITKEFVINNVNNILKYSKRGFSMLRSTSYDKNNSINKQTIHHFNKINSLIYEIREYLDNNNNNNLDIISFNDEIFNNISKNLSVVRIMSQELLYKYL